MSELCKKSLIVFGVSLSVFSNTQAACLDKTPNIKVHYQMDCQAEGLKKVSFFEKKTSNGELLSYLSFQVSGEDEERCFELSFEKGSINLFSLDNEPSFAIGRNLELEGDQIEVGLARDYQTTVYQNWPAARFISTDSEDIYVINNCLPF